MTVHEEKKRLLEEEPELARRYGFKREQLESLTSIGNASTVDVALAHVLITYINASHLYEGLTPQRVAEYMRVPEETIRLVFTDERLKSTLL